MCNTLAATVSFACVKATNWAINAFCVLEYGGMVGCANVGESTDAEQGKSTVA